MKTEENKHAVFSASGAHRWMNCPGSIELSKNAPPAKESSYALEGTEAHGCLEMFLKNGRDKADRTEAILKNAHPSDMVEHALDAAITIWGYAGEHELLCETKVSLEFVHPGMFGTVDAAVVDIFGTLHVFDFKYGVMPVHPDNNPQLIYYALGIAHLYDYDFSQVALHIIQPRSDHPDGPHRHWLMPIEELLEWKSTFKKAVDACEDPFAPFRAGEHCKYCPAKPICGVIADDAFHQAQIDFLPIAESETKNVKEPVLPTVKDFTALELPAILEALPKIKVWIDAVESHAQSILEQGGKISGYKLVAKRSTRKWSDIEKATKAAFKKWQEEIFTTAELLSPAQLEKKIGKDAKKFTAEHTIDVVPEGYTMVPESDKRPAISPVEHDFDEFKPYPLTMDPADAKALVDAKKFLKEVSAPLSEYDWKKKQLHKKFARRSRKNGTKTTKKKRKK